VPSLFGTIFSNLPPLSFDPSINFRHTRKTRGENSKIFIMISITCRMKKKNPQKKKPNQPTNKQTLPERLLILPLSSLP
jgi:hypothetical protein